MGVDYATNVFLFVHLYRGFVMVCNQAEHLAPPTPKKDEIPADRSTLVTLFDAILAFAIGQAGVMPSHCPNAMDHIIKDSIPLELYAWLDPNAEISGWDILSTSPFGQSLPEDKFTTVQNYFAEYHLEYYRQRLFRDFPSRLHALLFFATRIDAENFRAKHPHRVFGKHLVAARSKGDYVVSFHDSSWLDYLRLPHSLNLATLDEVSGHYWRGALVEEIGLRFLDHPWREPPVIEALFQGTLEPASHPHQTAWLPGFS